MTTTQTEPDKSSITDAVPHDSDDSMYPPFKKVLPAMLAVWLAFFVVALDRTIIGTAVPTITHDFDSFGDIAWYESGFLLPICVLQLSFGRIYRYYSAKWVMIINIAIFEIGSIVCAAAPNSKALIVGRVVSGIGAAGVPPGAFILVSFLVPLRSRPKYIGSLGSVFGVTSILGPVLGGYLTSITWRWCFWINLPIGGASMLLLVLLTPKCTPPVKRATTWKAKILELDPLGFLLVAVCLVCLLLAIQFGGKEYSWNSAVVIALFVISGLFGAAFAVAQVWRGEKGTIPPHITRQRSVLAGSFASLGIGSVLVLFSFYLPIWFQVVQNKSPQSSGLSLIPLLLSVVFAVIANGAFTSSVGYYVPSAIFGSMVTMVGAALISTWTADVGTGKWIGYQIMTGAGLGLILQGPNIAVQTVLSKEDVSIGLSVINLANFLGSTIFVTVGQALLQSQLVKKLKPVLPNVDLASLADGSATSVRAQASREELPAVLKSYNDSMRSIWYLALGLTAVVLVSSFGLEWKDVKKLKEAEKADAKDETHDEASTGVEKV